MPAVNDIIANSISDKEALGKLAEYIMQTLRASAMILDNDGNIISSALIEDKPRFDAADIKKINPTLLKSKKTYHTELFGMNCLVLPLTAVSRRFGTVFAYSSAVEYDNDTIELLFDVSNAAALLLRCIYVSRDISDIKNEETVKAALGSLSFSELNAAVAVFSHLKDKSEGIVISSNIAKESGITRSVIVNALKKLESASVIEIQSLGMKGTHINVVNPYIYKQIQQYERITPITR